MHRGRYTLVLFAAGGVVYKMTWQKTMALHCLWHWTVLLVVNKKPTDYCQEFSSRSLLSMAVTVEFHIDILT